MTTTDIHTPRSKGTLAPRIAVGSMILWGLLHVVGGLVLVAASSASGPDAIAAYATALPAVDLTDAADRAVRGLVGFHGFNIAAAGTAVAVLAWRGPDATPSIWLTPLIVATVADIGLVVFLLAPGIMATTDGAPGIALLLVALAATAAARRG